MNTSSQTLQSQGSPILLLTYLHREMGHLPGAAFSIAAHIPDTLEIKLHISHDVPAMGAFETWRVALGLGDPAVKSTADGSLAWLEVEGRVDDVPVRLTGFGTVDEVAAAVELRETVALLGALPMPAGIPVEDPHDSPLHQTYALGHDLPEVSLPSQLDRRAAL